MAALLIASVAHWLGLSTDTKPASARAGSSFYETDTGAVYLWDGAAWVLKLGPESLFRLNKTVTFTGAAGLGAVGNVPLATVTGEIEIVSLVPVVTVALEEAAPTATLALGFTGATTFFVAATNAAAQLTLGKVWFSATPGVVPLAIPAGFKNVWTSDHLVATVGAQAVSAGALRCDVLWRPLSPDGLLVAA